MLIANFVKCICSNWSYWSQPPLRTYLFFQRDEVFYTCAWSVDADAHELVIAAAGFRGVIRVLTPNMKYHRHFIGHGAAINEVKFHPKLLHVLLSASKDYSLRLWNVRTQVCIAVLGGIDGHRDEVLSADFDILGSRIVSSGMDHSVKVWNVDAQIQAVIAKSDEYKLGVNQTQFAALVVHTPDFSTRDVHWNYVDAVLWMGDFVLSKVLYKSIYSCCSLFVQHRFIVFFAISFSIATFSKPATTASIVGHHRNWAMTNPKINQWRL